MAQSEVDIEIRSLSELDISGIVEIDEKLSGQYRPEVWEHRVGYYLRRDPEVSLVALSGDQVVGFMLAEVRSGEFGLEEPAGWIEVMGIDPDFQGQAVGRRLGQEILQRIKERGAITVRTLVDDSKTDLSGFFTSLGFETAPLKAYFKTL